MNFKKVDFPTSIPPEYQCNPQSIQKFESVYDDFFNFFVDHEYSKNTVDVSEKMGNAFIITHYGRRNSNHQGAVYKLLLIIPAQYPDTKPYAQFLGILPFHFQVDEKGFICIDYLNKWDNRYKAEKLVIQIENLIYNPGSESGHRIQCIINNNQRIEECKAVAQLSKENMNLKY